MPEVLLDLEHLTPQWMTAVLYAKGLLTRGQVNTIHCSLQHTSIALVAHLELGYSTDVPQFSPSRLVVKMTRPDTLSHHESTVGKKEVAFYTKLDAVGELLARQQVQQSGTAWFAPVAPPPTRPPLESG
jgi:hypothetical protein